MFGAMRMEKKLYQWLGDFLVGRFLSSSSVISTGVAHFFTKVSHLIRTIYSHQVRRSLFPVCSNNLIKNVLKLLMMTSQWNWKSRLNRSGPNIHNLCIGIKWRSSSLPYCNLGKRIERRVLICILKLLTTFTFGICTGSYELCS
ncbi:hypothetical protein PoB_006397600 [Plakobranchus ocellatus]|uniref:Uncharacterized protein n=1 Tax=Plakobranchus ocellatus TaxID=259542 RepID=A0AAV4D0G8_9GAST|nr:hypothetical protein PoB_006397600 [Plakobranchus ocellatus]